MVLSQAAVSCRQSVVTCNAVAKGLGWKSLPDFVVSRLTAVSLGSRGLWHNLIGNSGLQNE